VLARRCFRVHFSAELALFILRRAVAAHAYIRNDVQPAGDVYARAEGLPAFAPPAAAWMCGEQLPLAHVRVETIYDDTLVPAAAAAATLTASDRWTAS
jgi:hypothetical protein